MQLSLELKPLEIIKEYRWITLDEQKQFCEFLKESGFAIDKIEWCATEFEKSRCAINYDHADKIHYLPCGLRGRCPRCSMSYAHDRADTMYRWIRRNIADKIDFDLKMNHIVLTLPEQFHDIETKLFSKMVNHFMKLYGLEAYGYSVHTRHSKDPLGPRYVHGHVLTLNIKQENNSLKQNDYYFNPGLMREHWKNTIQKFTGIEIPGEVNLKNVYASVINDSPKIRHWLAYLYRYPIQDLFEIQVRKGSINYLEKAQFKKINELINEPKPRLTWCGLLSSAKRRLLLKLLDLSETFWLDLPDIIQEKRIRANQCRDCGSPYEVYDRGKYEGYNEPIILN